MLSFAACLYRIAQVMLVFLHMDLLLVSLSLSLSLSLALSVSLFIYINVREAYAKLMSGKRKPTRTRTSSTSIQTLQIRAFGLCRQTNKLLKNTFVVYMTCTIYASTTIECQPNDHMNA